MKTYTIRTIQPADNKALALIIRNTLEEFKANKPGTVYFDNATDHLFEMFTIARSIYYVVEENGLVMGGAGIFPTEKLASGTCELVKFYLAPTARGKGIGQELMEKCIHAAKALGYKKIYLETMPELTIAIPMYEKWGFSFLGGPQGNSGHCGCDIWMIKELEE